jgi:hypothetical protein
MPREQLLQGSESMERSPTSPDHEQARLALEREKWDAEIALRREELDLKRSELSRSRWINPLVIAVLAAAVAALGNAGVSLVNSLQQLQLERERAQITQRLNAEQSHATITLEQSKSEAARILEVVKTNDPDKAAANLKFLIDTGLIADQTVRMQIQAYLDKRQPGEGVVLPTSQGLTVGPERDGSVSCSAASSYGIPKVNTAIVAALALPPLGIKLDSHVALNEKNASLLFRALGRFSDLFPGYYEATTARINLIDDGRRISIITDIRILVSRQAVTDLAFYREPTPSQLATYRSAVMLHLTQHLSRAFGNDAVCQRAV